ncbi:MAG: hypothetical protein KBC22_00580 [Candidatus Pacebacteria bacterium]|nr:hypothetical protein [Candidatus Paceibacterota bacterium]
MSLSQRIISIIMLVSSLVAIVFFAATPTIASADCDVTSAKFVNHHGEKPDSFYATAGTTKPTVIIEVQTTDCVGEFIKIRPSDPVVDATTFIESKILVLGQSQNYVEKTFLVPSTGLVRASFIAGEQSCDQSTTTFDCDYSIRVYPGQDTNTNILYNSFSTPQGRLKYNCEGACIDRWAVAPSSCNVTSAKFVNYFGEQHDSFYASSGNTSTPTVVVDVQTSNCFGEYIRIRPSDPVTGTGTSNEAKIITQAGVEKAFIVPESGLVRAFLIAGEMTCDSDPDTFDCDYHLRIYNDTNPTQTILYSSMSTAQGRLKYNCDGVCGSKWGSVLFPQGTNLAEVCFLMPASISPNGTQPANFYSDEQRPIVTVTIPTINCAGKTIKVSLTEEDNKLSGLVEDPIDDDANNLDNREITVPSDGTIVIELKSADENCDNFTTNSSAPAGVTRYNCSLHVETWSDHNLVSTTSKDRLEFNCDGNGCDDEVWVVQKHNGVDENGNPLYQGTDVEGLIIDPNDPCADTDSSGVTTLRDDCYTLLAPIGGINNIEGATLGKYLNMVIQIVISLAGVLAVIMIIVGGVQYMTTDAFAGKSDARATITKALLGLILALGSYLILKTINPNLLQLEPNIQKVELSVDAPPELNADGTYAGLADSSVATVTQGTAWPTPGLVDIRPDLPSGITVNKAECASVGASNCTATYFSASVAQSLLSKLTALKAACNCNIVITGGSEFWLHRTHGPGKTVLDFSAIPGNNGLTTADAEKLNNTFSGQGSFPGDNKYHTSSSLFDALAEVPKGGTKHWHAKK